MKVFYLLKRKRVCKREFCALKLYMGKAYDHVDWTFLNSHWREWGLRKMGRMGDELRYFDEL